MQVMRVQELAANVLCMQHDCCVYLLQIAMHCTDSVDQAVYRRRTPTWVLICFARIA